MIRNVLVALILMIGMSSPLAGQAENVFDGHDLQAFANVFVQSKQREAIHDSIISELLQTHEVPVPRFAQLYHALRTGQQLNLTENEQALLGAIQTEDERLKLKQQNDVKLLCEKEDLLYARYYSMLDRYRKRIGFQHMIRPYLDEARKRFSK